MKQLVLISGVSGVGKSTVISSLLRTDHSFTSFSIYTTRELRLGEDGRTRIRVTPEQMSKLKQDGDAVVTGILGNMYGAPVAKFRTAIDSGLVPVMDLNITLTDHVADLKAALPGVRMTTIYIKPPSIQEMMKRLGNRDMALDPERVLFAQNELRDVESGKYNQHINLILTNMDGRADELAVTIAKFAGVLRTEQHF
jgi:guanylate kinase